MPSRFRLFMLAFLVVTFEPLAAMADEKQPYAGPACTRPLDDYFAKEVWPKVGSALCLQCHKPGGDAEDSKFVLRDPRKLQAHTQDEAMQHNRELFAKFAKAKAKDQSRLLAKASGGLDHGGEDVVKPDSKGYQILAEGVRGSCFPDTGGKTAGHWALSDPGIAPESTVAIRPSSVSQ